MVNHAVSSSFRKAVVAGFSLRPSTAMDASHAP